MKLSTQRVLTALAYGLILLATIPQVAQYDTFSWALVPLWLVMTGYSASIMKATTKDHKKYDKYGDVVLLVWTTYYVLALVWPLPIHWFEIFVVMALIAYKDHYLASMILSMYYSFSAASYLENGDVMQLCGRSILAGLFLHESIVLHNERHKVTPDDERQVVTPDDERQVVTPGATN